MKRALIVDDSHFAREVLSRLLSQHGVAADTAESAEVALEYLNQSRPDVVFLDHDMPGLDGFEALEAIKKNPATATIPVMMYTSQEGEVYVGQARALGAIGVLPKAMQPVEVTQVLRTLRLISPPPDAPPDAEVPPAPTPAPPVAALPAAPDTTLRALDAHAMRELLESLFSEHATSLRNDVRRELQRMAAAAAATAPAAVPAPAPPPPAIWEPEAIPPAAGSASRIAIVAALVACGVLGYLYYGARSALEDANERVRGLAADIAATREVRPAAAASPAMLTQTTATSGVLKVLEWGINRGGSYAFDALPLDDDRATVLTALFAELKEIGFEGKVVIDVHVGRFCMKYGTDGVLRLAPAQQPASACDQVGWPEAEAMALGQRESLAYANTVASLAAQYPRLRTQIISHGSMAPLAPYPRADDLTAGAWNAIAHVNNRVSMQLIAD